jgi:hypothetical protein
MVPVASLQIRGRALRTHTHVVHEGPGTGSTYGRRNSNAFVQFLCGIALLVLAPTLLVAVELQAVKFARLLHRAHAMTISYVPNQPVIPGYEGRMIHTQGRIHIEKDAVDRETGVAFGPGTPGSAVVQLAGREGPTPSTPLVIERRVEVFQWVERQQQDNNETRYIYDQVWSEMDHDSTQFKYKQGHENPRRRVDLRSQTTMRSDEAKLGDLRLLEPVLHRATWWGECKVPLDATLGSALNDADARVTLDGAIYVPTAEQQSFLFFGKPQEEDAPEDANVERIGDMRISYRTVEAPPDVCTIIGVQSGASVRACTADDVAAIAGRVARELREEEGELREIEAKGDALVEAKGCCKVAAIGLQLVASLMLIVMRHAIGTDVLLFAPVKRSPHRFTSERSSASSGR